MNKGSTPNKLFFTLGGFAGSAYQVVWQDGKLWYSQRPPRGKMTNEVIEPDRAQWDAFWQELARLDVWGWQGDFSDMTVRDGTAWALEIEHEGQRVDTSGMNAYPPRGKGPDIPASFRRFLVALSSLLGGRSLI